MATVDMKSGVTLVRAGGATLAGATPYASNWVDTQGYEALTFAVHALTTTVAGTGGVAFKLQHSNLVTAASAVDCTADEVIGAVPNIAVNGDDDKIMGTVGYRGNRRYVRLVATGTTNTDGGILVTAILGEPHLADVPAVAASVAAT